jgi:hypothetical protein
VSSLIAALCLTLAGAAFAGAFRSADRTRPVTKGGKYPGSPAVYLPLIAGLLWVGGS